MARIGLVSNQLLPHPAAGRWGELLPALAWAAAAALLWRLWRPGSGGSPPGR